jgi:malate dehydrogenase
MAALLRAAGVSRTASKAMQQTRGYKVAVLGAAGGIGQPCGLLMKMVRRSRR